MIILYVALALVVLPVLYFMWARLYVMVLAPKSIQGSDLHMFKWCAEENTRAWGGFHLTLDGGMDYADVKRIVTENITEDMKNPESTYRRGCDLEKRRFVFYDDYTPADVLEVTSDDERFFRLDDARKRELVYRFHDDRHLIGALFDHTVWDGIRMFNETLTPAIDSKPFDSRWLLKEKYIPVLAELLMLYASAQMAVRWVSHKPMPLLENSDDQHVLRHKFPIEDIKALKGRAGCKFTSALLAMWANRLFESIHTDRKAIRFGLIVGMNNPRFRNNYSIITVDVPRSSSMEEQCKTIERQVKRRSIEVMPLYHLMSFLELQTLFKKTMVDALFSPAVFEKGGGPSRHVQDLFFYIIPTSMPLYSFACSLDDVVTVSTTYNCPEIDLEQLSSDATAVFKVNEDKVIEALKGDAGSRPVQAADS